GADDWLRVPSERCARKQKLGRPLPRSLQEKMKRAMADDAEFRVKVECQHSCRLFASLPSISSDMGFLWENGMPPIAEEGSSVEENRPDERCGRRIDCLCAARGVGPDNG
ncbi:hypothetical protein Dimus_015954, partial [Dionaea muscipula]